jgi:hypothetical protein
MRALGCPEAKDTALGASCEVVTANVQRKDIIAMDLACRTARAGCDPGSCR